MTSRSRATPSGTSGVPMVAEPVAGSAVPATGEAVNMRYRKYCSANRAWATSERSVLARIHSGNAREDMFSKQRQIDSASSTDDAGLPHGMSMHCLVDAGLVAVRPVASV